MVNAPFVLSGLLYEAWVRCFTSYNRSVIHYQIRLIDGLQPQLGPAGFNFFNSENQQQFLLVGNLVYFVTTVCLFFYMKKRKAGFRLRWILVFYDASNVALAGYIAVSTIQYKLHQSGLLLCNPIASDTAGYKIASVFAVFYMQKFYEFCDTWFFVLRKSHRQVTLLHLFHHSCLTIVVGAILPFDYNGDLYLPILLNSINNMLLHIHYLLSTVGIRSLWAGYISSIQLVQFIVIFAQNLLAYRVGPTCGLPDYAKLLLLAYTGVMIVLICQFFLQKHVFRRQLIATDLCGVIKRPQRVFAGPTQHCGVIELDATGSGVVVLPDDGSFPDAELMARSSLWHRQFQILYFLTAVGHAMPNLHVSREVSRMRLDSKNDFCSVQTAKTSSRKADQEEILPSVTTARRSAKSSKPSQKYNDRLIDGPLPPLDSMLFDGLDRLGKSIGQAADNAVVGAASGSATSTISNSESEQVSPNALPIGDLNHAMCGCRSEQRIINTGSVNKQGEREPNYSCCKAPNNNTTINDHTQITVEDDDGRTGFIAKGTVGYDELQTQQTSTSARNQSAGTADCATFWFTNQPLSFTISGGAPLGKVSWMVHTVPSANEPRSVTSSNLDINCKKRSKDIIQAGTRDHTQRNLKVLMKKQPSATPIDSDDSESSTSALLSDSGNVTPVPNASDDWRDIS